MGGMTSRAAVIFASTSVPIRTTSAFSKSSRSPAGATAAVVEAMPGGAALSAAGTSVADGALVPGGVALSAVLGDGEHAQRDVRDKRSGHREKVMSSSLSEDWD